MSEVGDGVRHVANLKTQTSCCAVFLDPRNRPCCVGRSAVPRTMQRPRSFRTTTAAAPLPRETMSAMFVLVPGARHGTAPGVGTRWHPCSNRRETRLSRWTLPPLDRGTPPVSEVSRVIPGRRCQTGAQFGASHGEMTRASGWLSPCEFPGRSEFMSMHPGLVSRRAVDFVRVASALCR